MTIEELIQKLLEKVSIDPESAKFEVFVESRIENIYYGEIISISEIDTNFKTEEVRIII